MNLMRFVPVLALFIAACSHPTEEVEAADSPITTEEIKLPPGDPCALVLRPLAEAVALSTLGGRLQNAKSVEVKFLGSTYIREYEIFVDGVEFTANGQEFENDWTYKAVLDNDSSFKCHVLSLEPKG